MKKKKEDYKPRYKYSDVELLFHKMNYEGDEYALIDYSSWLEFDGTPLGDAIKAYREAKERVIKEVNIACEEVGLD